jgi:hypothetical protein
MPSDLNQKRPSSIGSQDVWVLVLGVFLVHLGMVLWSSTPRLSGDEPRYWLMAQHLIHGTFASRETRLLWNGPGYPMSLIPWVSLELPYIFPRSINALWMSLAAFASWKWFSILGLPRPTLQAGLLSLYLLLHGSLSDRLMSEPMAVALVALGAWATTRVIELESPLGKGQQLWRFLLAAAVWAALALTKVFFAYVLTSGFFLATTAWLFTVCKKKYRNKKWNRDNLYNGNPIGNPPAFATSSTVMIAALALSFCLPYLLYTWQLTGRLFYWGNSGGAQLYCLSLPETQFLGDWQNSDAVIQNPEFYGQHAAFYAALDTLDFVTQDDRLKAAAMQNFRKYPEKAFTNWRANVNRMILGQPISNYPGNSQELKSGNRAIFQGMWFYACLLAILAVFYRRGIRLPPSLYLLSSFALISVLGLSLLSSEPRLVFPLIPIFYGVVAYSVLGSGYQIKTSAYARRVG